MENITEYNEQPQKKAITITLIGGECDAFVHFLDSVVKETGLKHVEMVAFLKQKYLSKNE